MEVRQGGAEATHRLRIRPRKAEVHSRATRAVRQAGLGPVCWWGSRHLSKRAGWELMVAGEDALERAQAALDAVGVDYGPVTAVEGEP